MLVRHSLETATQHKHPFTWKSDMYHAQGAQMQCGLKMRYRGRRGVVVFFFFLSFFVVLVCLFCDLFLIVFVCLFVLICFLFLFSLIVHFFVFLLLFCCFYLAENNVVVFAADRYTEKEGVFNSVRALIETSSSR